MRKKSISLHINKQCNFACKYCYWNNHEKEEMSDEISDKIISFLNNNPDKYEHIIFIGGEPFLSVNIMLKFIKALKDSFTFEIMTNGSIHPKVLFDKLNQNEKCRISISFSYDGLFQNNRKKNSADTILRHIKYAKNNSISHGIVSMDSPDYADRFIENMLYLIKQTKSFSFCRICDLPNKWPKDKLKQHLKDWNKIVDIASYYNTCKGYSIMLPNRVESLPGDIKQSEKEINCQRNLLYMDCVGLDGKKYLCEPAYTENAANYGYLWEEHETLASEYDKKHHDCPYYVCLYYRSKDFEYEKQIEKKRLKYHKRKQKLSRLKEDKEKQLLKKDPKGRLLRLARDYYWNGQTVVRHDN